MQKTNGQNYAYTITNNQIEPFPFGECLDIKDYFFQTPDVDVYTFMFSLEMT